MQSELIETFRLILKPIVRRLSLSLSEFEEVFELAQRGAALKPKPLSEAPKDGTWLLGWTKGSESEARPFAWNKKKKAWCDLPDGDRFETYGVEIWITHFVPLSLIIKE